MTEESPKNVLPLPSLVEKTVQNCTGETRRPQTSAPKYTTLPSLAAWDNHSFHFNKHYL